VSQFKNTNWSSLSPDSLFFLQVRSIIFFLIYPQARCMAWMFTSHKVTKPETRDRDVISSRLRHWTLETASRPRRSRPKLHPWQPQTSYIIMSRYVCWNRCVFSFHLCSHFQQGTHYSVFTYNLVQYRRALLWICSAMQGQHLPERSVLSGIYCLMQHHVEWGPIISPLLETGEAWSPRESPSILRHSIHTCIPVHMSIMPTEWKTLELNVHRKIEPKFRTDRITGNTFMACVKKQHEFTIGVVSVNQLLMMSISTDFQLNATAKVIHRWPVDALHLHLHFSIIQVCIIMLVCGMWRNSHASQLRAHGFDSNVI